MVRLLVSVEVEQEDWEYKRNHGVTWRYLVRKGIEHMKECIPREREIAAKYDSVLRASRHARLMHILKEKHPDIYNEVLDLDTTQEVR